MIKIYKKPNIKNYSSSEILNIMGPGHSASGYVNIQGAQVSYNTEHVQKEESTIRLVQLKQFENKDKILG